MNKNNNNLKSVTELELELKKPFSFDEIEWRIGSSYERNGEVKALALPYVTSRAIMDRLDSVFGIDGWEDEYQPWGNNAQLCAITVRIGDRSVKKWDGAEMTDYESVKGGLSNALKRTAVKFGIGRYLYSFDQIWVKCEQRGKTKVIAKEEFTNTLSVFYSKQLAKIFGPEVQSKKTNSNGNQVNSQIGYGENNKTNHSNANNSVWEKSGVNNNSERDNIYVNNQKSNNNISETNYKANNNNSYFETDKVESNIPPAFLSFIKARINATGKGLQSILTYYKVGSLEQLTMEQANDLVSKLS